MLGVTWLNEGSRQQSKRKNSGLEPRNQSGSLLACLLYTCRSRNELFTSAWLQMLARQIKQTPKHGNDGCVQALTQGLYRRAGPMEGHRDL